MDSWQNRAEVKNRTEAIKNGERLIRLCKFVVWFSLIISIGAAVDLYRAKQQEHSNHPYHVENE